MATGPSLFDRWSATYDHERLQQSTYKPIHDEVVTRLQGCGSLHILDLGCGTGQLTKVLADSFPESGVVGVDLSSGMLERASHRLEQVRTGGAVLVRGDANSLPFTAGSFTVITCTESFHWYGDQLATMRALRALLAPGGRIMVASIATFTTFGEDALRLVSGVTGHTIRALTADHMRTLMEEAGLEVLAQRRIRRPGFLPPPLFTEAVRPGAIR